MAAAGALGYLAEPSLRFQLTGMQPSAVENGENTRVVLQMPVQLWRRAHHMDSS